MFLLACHFNSLQRVLWTKVVFQMTNSSVLGTVHYLRYSDILTGYYIISSLYRQYSAAGRYQTVPYELAC
jgi:hypothetical protein